MTKKIAMILGFFLGFQCLITAQVQVKKTPSWVQLSSYNKNPKINSDENSQGTLELLYDNQVNCITEQVYYRFVIKILENVGIQPASTINVPYDPSYQSLVFHSISIIRDGQVISKLKPADFQLIRKESNSENYIYDGTMTAINNLSDVRNGDIVDYSFTITGMNPIHENKISTSVVLSNYVPFGKLNFAFHHKKPLQFQYKNTDRRFRESRENGWYVYRYEQSNIDAVDFEENMPQWVIANAMVFISDYASWKEVANWGTKIFKVKEAPNRSLQAKIDEIKRLHKIEGERITATLNFVQDEIRYLGLESGIGSYKPFQPNKVFEQRFGDCKDKSLLMVHMLNEMGIKAYPVLVSTTFKGSMKEFLPSPKYFDHCIVKVIDQNNKDWWYDPTISNQGGDYRNTSIPNYQLGFVLKRNNADFDVIDLREMTNNVDIVDEFILDEVGKGATLNITSTYYDSEADALRNFYKNNSLKNIKRDYESYMANYYPSAKSTQNPIYEDHLEDNVFIIKEQYTIDSLWVDSPVDNKNVFASFYPYAILDALTMPSKSERSHPYYLYYPTTKNHTIKLKLPTRWNIKDEFISAESESMEYSLVSSYDQRDRLLTLKYNMRTLNDHVAVSDFPVFYAAMDKINKNISYSLIYPKSGNVLGNIDASSFGQLLGKLLFGLVILILIIVGIVKLSGKSSHSYDRRRTNEYDRRRR